MWRALSSAVGLCSCTKGSSAMVCRRLRILAAVLLLAAELCSWSIASSPEDSSLKSETELGQSPATATICMAGDYSCIFLLTVAITGDFLHFYAKVLLVIGVATVGWTRVRPQIGLGPDVRFVHNPFIQHYWGRPKINSWLKSRKNISWISKALSKLLWVTHCEWLLISRYLVYRWNDYSRSWA